MAMPPHRPPSRWRAVMWLALVLAAMAGIWYYFLGPGVNAPWPWEVRWKLPWRGR